MSAPSSSWSTAPSLSVPPGCRSRISICDIPGLQTKKQHELYAIGTKAHLAGWQLGTHCNGNLAIREVMDVYERIHAEHPIKDPRFRLEHCTQVDAALVSRIAALKALPIPFACYVYFHGDVMHFYGEKRTA